MREDHGTPLRGEAWAAGPLCLKSSPHTGKSSSEEEAWGAGRTLRGLPHERVWQIRVETRRVPDLAKIIKSSALRPRGRIWPATSPFLGSASIGDCGHAPPRASGAVAARAGSVAAPSQRLRCGDLVDHHDHVGEPLDGERVEHGFVALAEPFSSLLRRFAASTASRRASASSATFASRAVS